MRVGGTLLAVGPWHAGRMSESRSESAVENRAELKARIANTDETEAVMVTDSHGGVRESSGTPRGAGLSEVAAALDVLVGALQASGHKLAAGTFRDAILTFEDGALIVASDGSDGNFAVLAESDASAGLLLNQVRRLLLGVREPSPKV